MGLRVSPYPRGCVVNSSMSSESQFYVLLMVPNMNKPIRWESIASPNLPALKRDMSSVQVGGNVYQSKYNDWMWSI